MFPVYRAKWACWAAVASALVSSQLNYANYVLGGSLNQKNVSFIEDPECDCKSCNTKPITSVLNPRTLWTPLVANFIVASSSSWLLLLSSQVYAYWNPPLPLSSSYSLPFFPCS